MKLVFDANFAHTNVGQGVDENGWTWEEIFGVSDGCLVRPVRI